VSGRHDLPLRFEYRIAIQGHGAFVPSYGIGMQLPGLQLVHSNYDQAAVPWSTGTQLVVLGDQQDKTAIDFRDRSLARKGLVLWDSRRAGGTNTLRLVLHELIVDAYRARDLSLSATLHPDGARPAAQWLPWHPHIRNVEDREFPIRGGFRGTMSISDPKLLGRPFCSTVYSRSSISFDTCGCPEEALDGIGDLGDGPVSLVAARDRGSASL